MTLRVEDAQLRWLEQSSEGMKIPVGLVFPDTTEAKALKQGSCCCSYPLDYLLLYLFLAAF